MALAWYAQKELRATPSLMFLMFTQIGYVYKVYQKDAEHET